VEVGGEKVGRVGTNRRKKSTPDGAPGGEAGTIRAGGGGYGTLLKAKKGLEKSYVEGGKRKHIREVQEGT